MKYLGRNEGYSVYQFDDGHPEGYRSTGKVFLREGQSIPKNINRIVTTATTIDEFINQIRRKQIQTKKPAYNPYKDDSQLQLNLE